MQRLKLAAWLHTTEASLAVLSHLLRVSCDILRKAGGVEASAAFLSFPTKATVLFAVSHVPRRDFCQIGWLVGVVPTIWTAI